MKSREKIRFLLVLSLSVFLLASVKTYGDDDDIRNSHPNPAPRHDYSKPEPCLSTFGRIFTPRRIKWGVFLGISVGTVIVAFFPHGHDEPYLQYLKSDMAGEAFHVQGLAEVKDLLQKKNNGSGQALPRIVIIPESHQSCPDCKKSRKAHTEKCHQGLCFYGVEGSPYGVAEGESKLAGIDDPVTNGFLHAFHSLVYFKALAQNKTEKREKAWNDNLKTFGKMLDLHPEIWERDVKPQILLQFGSHDKGKKTVALFDQMRQYPDLAPQIFEQEKKLLEDPDLFYEISQKISEKSLKKAKAYVSQSNTPTDFTFAEQLLEPSREVDPHDHAKLVAFYNLGWRERILAINAAQLFAEKAGPQGKDLYLRVGSGHATRMQKLLRSSFDRSGGKEFPIEIDKSILDHGCLDKKSRHYEEIEDF